MVEDSFIDYDRKLSDGLFGLHSVRVLEQIAGDQPRRIYTPGQLCDFLLASVSSTGQYSFLDFQKKLRAGQISDIVFYEPPQGSRLIVLPFEAFWKAGKPRIIEVNDLRVLSFQGSGALE